MMSMKILLQTGYALTDGRSATRANQAAMLVLAGSSG
jgi:hypothetical protein